MRGTAALGVRLAASTLLALALLLVLSPPRPPFRAPLAQSMALGLAAGMLLFVTVTRRPPGRPVTGRLDLAVFGSLVLGVAAVGEEIVWRRVVLGELLRAGPLAAVAGSTLGFALAHRVRPGLHLGTGAVFGGVYLATGALAASVAAHWVYNVLLLWLAGTAHAKAEVPP